MMLTGCMMGVDCENTDGVKQLVILRSSEGLWITGTRLLTHSEELYGQHAQGS
jgi:hypothetical protein